MQRCKNNVDGVCQLEGELCPGDRPCAELVEDGVKDTVIPADSYPPPSGIGMQHLRLGIERGPFDIPEKVWFAMAHDTLVDECRRAANKNAPAVRIG